MTDKLSIIEACKLMKMDPCVFIQSQEKIYITVRPKSRSSKCSEVSVRLYGTDNRVMKRMECSVSPRHPRIIDDGPFRYLMLRDAVDFYPDICSDLLNYAISEIRGNKNANCGEAT